MRTLIAAAMLSTAVLRVMPDDGGAGGGSSSAASDPTRIDKLRDAVNGLDDANDSHWNADGSAKMEAVEAIFGDSTPTRAEVDAIGRVREPQTQPAPAPIFDPQPEQPPRQAVAPGRMVTLRFSKPFDGATSAPGMVLKVYDDGTINVKAFAPNGGADRTVTGVMHAEDVAAMADGADKNAALSVTWDWPPRV